MCALRITTDTAGASAMLTRLKKGLSRSGADGVIQRVAAITHRRLVQQTPKKWTGQTRRGWTVVRGGPSEYTVMNRSKVMGFLEYGTRAHGPVDAQKLFIPLTKRAANAGPRGVRAANLAAHRRSLGLNAPGGRKFIPGRDFIYVRRVKGIRAMRIVRNYAPFVRITLKAAMRLHVRNIIRR